VSTSTSTVTSVSTTTSTPPPVTSTTTQTTTTTVTGPTTTSTTTATTTTTLPPVTSTTTQTETTTQTSTSTVITPTTTTETSTSTTTQTETSTVTSPTTSTTTTTTTVTIPPVTSTTTQTETTTSTTTQTSTVTTPTTTTTTVKVPTGNSLTCGGSPYLQVGQSINCQATISPADEGLETGTVTWTTSGGGTFSQEQCNNPNGQGQIQCQAQYTAKSGGVQTIGESYSGDVYHSPSSASFLVFVGGLAGSPVTSTVMTCGGNPYLQVGQNVNCQATISSADGRASSGPVTWSVSGGGSLTQEQCNNPNGQGQIQCQAQFTAGSAGIWTVQLVYAGTAGHSSSTGTFELFVVHGNNPITAQVVAPAGAALIAGLAFVVVQKRKDRKGVAPVS
jgi:hypothetical protein